MLKIKTKIKMAGRTGSPNPVPSSSSALASLGWVASSSGGIIAGSERSSAI
jgi:hypothetical protein